MGKRRFNQSFLRIVMDCDLMLKSSVTKMKTETDEIIACRMESCNRKNKVEIFRQ